jgi:hypothetical protein
MVNSILSYGSVSMDDFNQRWAEEKAKLANLPNVVERAATLLLTNRALAVALLQLDTNISKYSDIRDFLDAKILSTVEQSLSAEALNIDEPEDDTEEIPAWKGKPGTPCSGVTLKGVHCRSRGVYEHDGKPFCKSHYPYPECYLEAKQESRDKFEKHWNRKRDLLKQYDHFEKLMHGLDEMNRDLSSAFRALNLEPISIPQLPTPNRGVTSVRIDGLSLQLETALDGQIPSWWIRKEEHRIALLQQIAEEEWRAFPLEPNTGALATRDVWSNEDRQACIRYGFLHAMFYRVRHKRDRAWYGRAVCLAAAMEGTLTSGQALMDLCGIPDPGSGWRVFRQSLSRGWECEYGGHSEAEARWIYQNADRKPGASWMLINPSHLVEDTVDSRQMW